MTVMLDYLQQRLTGRDEGTRLGRASCNRAVVSLVVFWLYLLWFPHEDWARLDFFAKRVLPVALVAVGMWGMAYGIRGLSRDTRKVAAAAGLALNTVSVFYHGIYACMVGLEVYYAYHDYGGVITVMYR